MVINLFSLIDPQHAARQLGGLMIGAESDVLSCHLEVPRALARTEGHCPPSMDHGGLQLEGHRTAAGRKTRKPKLLLCGCGAPFLYDRC